MFQHKMVFEKDSVSACLLFSLECEESGSAGYALQQKLSDIHIYEVFGPAAVVLRT